MRYLFLLFFIIVKISSNELDIDLFAKNAVLINAENGKILFKKNANELSELLVPKDSNNLEIYEKYKKFYKKNVEI